MKLMKWYPGVTGVTALQDDVEDLFNNLFLANRRRVDLGSGVWIPRVNIREHVDKYELTAEIPGMNKDEISIELQDNNLTIRGEKRAESETKDERFHVCERVYGKFERSFLLPEDTSAEGVEAEYKDGILALSIPKTEKPKPKEIKVRVK